MILKAFWQHKIDINDLLRVEMSHIEALEGKLCNFLGKLDNVQLCETQIDI